jgi:hypothetical protein
MTLALIGALVLLATSPVSASHTGKSTIHSIVHHSDTRNIAPYYSATFNSLSHRTVGVYIRHLSTLYAGRRKTPECEQKASSAGRSLLPPSLKKVNRRTPPKKNLDLNPSTLFFFPFSPL